MEIVASSTGWRAPRNDIPIRNNRMSEYKHNYNYFDVFLLLLFFLRGRF